MIKVRKSNERGHANHGWLDTYHSFSFAGYYDPNHMGFRALRVINEDRVSPGRGFGSHPHADMEIVTYVLSGALAHKDSMGNGSILKANELQRITAGTGIVHSEFNASKSDPVHFLQIWIEPEAAGLEPGYEQFTITEDDKRNRLRLLAGDNGAPLKIHQDARLSIAALDATKKVEYQLEQGRHSWVHAVRGAGTVNGVSLEAGDAAIVSGERELTLQGNDGGAEFLLFDLA